MPERLLTPDELAEYLNVSKATVYDWSRTGTGPTRFRVGRHIRYRIEDVMAWLDARRVPA